jgi:hypothetical protein
MSLRGVCEVFALGRKARERWFRVNVRERARGGVRTCAQRAFVFVDDVDVHGLMLRWWCASSLGVTVRFRREDGRYVGVNSERVRNMGRGSSATWISK